MDEKYGRNFLKDTLAFHIVVISTPLLEKIKSEDLSGEDSLEKFLESLLSK